MDALNHLRQPSLFGLTKIEEEGVCKRLDSMRGKDASLLTPDEETGVALAEEPMLLERNRRKGLGFPKVDKQHDLVGLADELTTVWKSKLK